MSLNGKRVLITAGPTWIPIDRIRIISNLATGTTGMLIARNALAHGAKVTLLLGPPHQNFWCGGKSIRIIRFHFFNELKKILKRELKNNKYDIIIHSAAVSDFKSDCRLKGKLSSDRVHRLRLVPTEKLIIQIRQHAQEAKLVMFKLELAVTDKILIQRARRAKDKVGANLIVANRLKPYRAFIIDKENNHTSVKSKQELAKKLINILHNI